MYPRSPENLVNVGTIAFLLDTKTHVEPMAEYIVVKNLEYGVMILWWILLHIEILSTHNFHCDTPKIKDDGKNSCERLCSSPGHARDDDDDDDVGDDDDDDAWWL